MKIIVANTYEAMCTMALDDLILLTQPISNPLVCPASGDSPKGLYEQLVNRVATKQLDVSHWNFVGLDEWGGINGSDEGSCRFHLNNQLFGPLKVPGDKLAFYDGRAEDLQAECQRIEDFITDHNGIDVAIVGLGMNGHVGMNEPGTPANLHSHVAEIDAVTQQVGQKYFTQKQSLTQGLTLGIANLMEAKNIMLLVSGKKKAAIVKRMLEEEISEQLPAGLLRNHPGLVIYLDKDAASLIQAS